MIGGGGLGGGGVKMECVLSWSELRNFILILFDLLEVFLKVM